MIAGIVCRICRSPQVRIVIGAMRLQRRLPSTTMVSKVLRILRIPPSFFPHASTWLTAEFNEPAEVFLISPTAVCQQKNIAQYSVRYTDFLVEFLSFILMES